MSNPNDSQFLQKYVKIVSSFFSRAYLSVVLDDRICLCELSVYKNKKLIKTEKKEFKTVHYEIPIEAQRHIKKIQRKYRFCYVSTIFTALNQGALDITSKQELARFHIDSSDIELLNSGEQWSIYGYATDIYETKSAFESSGGVDFVFSPFALLHFLGEEHLGEGAKALVLLLNKSVALIVADQDSVKFGGYFLLHTKEEETQGNEDDDSIDIVDEEKNDEQDALEELPLEDNSLDELEDLGDLEELKDDGKMEDFQDGTAKKEEESGDTEEDNSDSLDDFSRGMDIAAFMKKAFDEYYKSDAYSSDFIESIFIFDATNIDKDVIEYINNTFLLDVERINIDICEAVNKIAMHEVAL